MDSRPQRRGTDVHKTKPRPCRSGPRAVSPPTSRRALSLPSMHLPAGRGARGPRDRVPNARTAERSETHGAAETLTQACDSVQTGGGRKTSSGKGGDPGHKAPSSTRHFFRVQTQQHLFGAKKRQLPGRAQEDGVRSVPPVKYDSPMKRNETRTHTRPRINLEVITRRERSQSPETTSYFHRHGTSRRGKSTETKQMSGRPGLGAGGWERLLTGTGLLFGVMEMTRN